MTARPASLRVLRLRAEGRLPARAYAHDAGLDLHAAGEVVVAPGGRAAVPCGIAVELPPGHCGLVLPRSGLAERHGVTVLNAPGLIDAGFRGEVRVVLQNHGSAPFAVQPGMRVAQLLVVAVPVVAVAEADALAGSERGERGFGSSGTAAADGS